MRALPLIGSLAWLAGCTDIVIERPRPDAGPPAIAKLVVEPASVDFGSVAVSKTSPPVVFTLMNTGNATSGAPVIEVSHEFQKLTNCQALPAGGRCTISVDFVPTTAGTKYGVLVIRSAMGGVSSATLSGVGVVPEVAVAPPNHDFGVMVVGGSSELASFTVTNSGGAPLPRPTVSITGTDFELEESGCVQAPGLAPGEWCTERVRFKPLTRGLKGALLMVTAGELTAKAGLSGTASNPALFATSPRWARLAGKVGVETPAATTASSPSAGPRPAISASPSSPRHRA